jgi:hypothetical protein
MRQRIITEINITQYPTLINILRNFRDFFMLRYYRENNISMTPNVQSLADEEQFRP